MGGKQAAGAPLLTLFPERREDEGVRKLLLPIGLIPTNRGKFKFQITYLI